MLTNYAAKLDTIDEIRKGMEYNRKEGMDRARMQYHRPCSVLSASLEVVALTSQGKLQVGAAAFHLQKDRYCLYGLARCRSWLDCRMQIPDGREEYAIRKNSR